MSLKVTMETKLKPLPKLTILLPPFCGFMIDDIVTCNICLEDNDGNIEVDGCISGRIKRRLITSCGHIFHKACLQQWTSACNKGLLYGLITCPCCRGPVYMDEESTEAKKKLFAALASCDCCIRHQSVRPLSYAYDAELDARTMSKEQEEALNTLSTDEYIAWCNNNNWRRLVDLNRCSCDCRSTMRTMIRHIPPPSSYDWTCK